MVSKQVSLVELLRVVKGTDVFRTEMMDSAELVHGMHAVLGEVILLLAYSPSSFWLCEVSDDM